MINVSVIIPTYGKPEFLEKSIESVLGQTLKTLELIVVDDNDPDTVARKQTEQLLDKFIANDNRVIYLKHDHNRNGAVARNTGIKKAKGKYIAFLDSDDEYLPKRLEICAAAMDKADSSIAGVYTGCEFRRGGKTYHTHTDVKAGNFLVETLACTFMFCTGSNLFIRRSVVEEINGFDGAFLRHQDYEFLERIFRKYSLLAIPDVLVVKNNENVNLPNVQKMIDIKKQYLKKFKPDIAALTQQERDYIYHAQCIQVAEAAARSHDMKLAREYYRKAGQHGSVSAKELMRRIVFTVQNIIQRR